MKLKHRSIVAAVIVVVVLITVFSAPSVGRIPLAEAKAMAAGGDSPPALDSIYGAAADTLADGTDSTTSPTTTDTAPISSERRFEPFGGTPAAIPGRIEAEDYDTGTGLGLGMTEPRETRAALTVTTTSTSRPAAPAT